ncbi:MAG: hypothetical protein ACLQDV_13740 [Candidatus Binataceae bacterium]
MHKRRSTTAFFAAALIVLAQLAGAAHFHSYYGGHTREAQIQTSADSDLCAVCLLASHTPAVATPSMAPLALVSEARAIVATDPVEVLRTAFEDKLVRGPPAAL